MAGQLDEVFSSESMQESVCFVLQRLGEEYPLDYIITAVKLRLSLNHGGVDAQNWLQTMMPWLQDIHQNQ
jgi:hypothetical protein